jgi:pyruvate dehydrogenase (quinone)
MTKARRFRRVARQKLPGRISADQAVKFAESLAGGEKYRWEILKTLAKDKVREVVW